MTCRQVVEFLFDYLNDDLPAAEREHFEEHLAECPECVAYLSSYQRTVAVAKLAFDEAVGIASDSIPDELVRAILCARTKTSAQ